MGKGRTVRGGQTAKAPDGLPHGKLRAILCLDIVGYSRLMGEDEVSTIVDLDDLRTRLIFPEIERHEGKGQWRAGDCLMAHFDSVLEAGRCALDIQRRLAEENTGQGKSRFIQVRMGINVGDVFDEYENIVGDAVNIAARIQALCEPGEIFVSQAAYQQLRRRIDAHLEDLGRQSLKNIAEPLRIYRLRADSTRRPAWWAPLGRLRRRARQAVPLLSAAALVAAGVTAWMLLSPPGEAPVSVELPALPPGPSLAVIPFDNISESADQSYLAAGLTTDLITDLAQLPGLFVIARQSIFGYQDKPINIQDVSTELGVRYILTGSIRRRGDDLRINAHLIDGTNEKYVWADRYQGNVEDLLRFNDQVVQEIAIALSIKLSGEAQIASRSKYVRDFRAIEFYLRAREFYFANTPADLERARDLALRAIGIANDFSEAHGLLATIYWTAYDRDWIEALGIGYEAAFDSLLDHLELALKRPHPMAYQTLSLVRAYEEDYEAALKAAEQAIRLDHSNPLGHKAEASALILSGRPEEAVGSISQAIRIDPQNRLEYWYWLGRAFFGMEDYEQAETVLLRAVKENQQDNLAVLMLAATYGQLGKGEDASNQLEAFNQLRQANSKPRFRLGELRTWKLKRPEDRARLCAGLAAAGAPGSCP